MSDAGAEPEVTGPGVKPTRLTLFRHSARRIVAAQSDLSHFVYRQFLL
jgi:hypothetical protein